MHKFLSTFILSLLLSLACSAGDVQWVSTAKLLVGGAEVNPKLDNGEPIPDSFYATNVELLQTSEVHYGARARVHALHPDLPPELCKLEVVRLPGTRIIALHASAPAPAYAQAYLDAVMDEFLAKWKEMRAGGREGMLMAVMDEVRRLEREIPLAEQGIKASELNGTKPDQLVEPKAKLQQMKMAYDRLLGTSRKLQDQLGSGQVFSIIERASKSVSVKPGFSLPNLFK